MDSSDKAARRFIKALLPGRTAERQADGSYAFNRSGRTLQLDQTRVYDLLHNGVLTRAPGQGMLPGARAKAWLAAFERPADQRTPAANVSESPLARLAQPDANGNAFLQAHHIEAGERLRRTVERAHLMARTTMSYDPARTGTRNTRRPGGGDISDTAIEARRQLARYLDLLPRECAGVVLDVCGLLKGLQTVEAERGWPRRSAKLILRIGLDQLARQMGLEAEAIGPSSRRAHTRRETRPTRWE